MLYGYIVWSFLCCVMLVHRMSAVRLDCLVILVVCHVGVWNECCTVALFGHSCVVSCWCIE